MRLHLNLFAPRGEAQRRLIEKACVLVALTNEWWLAAKRNGAKPFPASAKKMGIQYRPPQGAEKLTPDQEFLWAEEMMRRGYGSCCDIAAYDAAVLEVVWNVKAQLHVPHTGDTSFHVSVMTPFGIYDPAAHWDDPDYDLPVPGSGVSITQTLQRLAYA